MDAEEKKTNMNVRVSKSVRDQLAGIALLEKLPFPDVLENAMKNYIAKYGKELKDE